MKSIWHYLPAVLLLLFSHAATGQSLGDRILNKAKQRADRKVDKTIDKGLDKVEKGIDEGAKGGNAQNSSGEQKKDAKPEAQKSDEKAKTEGTSSDFKAYSKFDFIPGEKVIVFEDFSQDAVGDFPAKWNTNSSAEIVTLNNQEGQWLALTTAGVVTPDFITSLPENFTLEFDLMTTPGYSFYDSRFYIHLLAAKSKKEVINWNSYARTGIEIDLHPQDAGTAPQGSAGYAVFSKGGKTMENSMNGLTAFNARNKNRVHIAIWRQNQRLRVYVDESKIWDLPRVFEKDLQYNNVLFEKKNAKDGNNYYIKDVRLAIGKPDTRSKLLTEGKFSTTGIYFNTNSADIKSESYAVLKEIADVLKENPTVKIKIVGHTDADGDDQYNLDLSKKRAMSVKQALAHEFSIDENRITTDGKGESEPVSPNTTTEGKAANRRVEFIKM